MFWILLLVSLPILLCNKKSEPEEEVSKKSKNMLKQTPQKKVPVQISNTSSKKKKSKMKTAKERVEERKKSSKKNSLPVDPTQPTIQSTRSNYKSLYVTEANSYEKAAYADGTIVDPSKVKRMGGLEPEDKKRKETIEQMSASKGIQSEDTKDKDRVTIRTEKCFVFEVPDEPTFDEEGVEELEPTG